MEMSYKEKFRAEELEKENKHYELKKRIHEANERTREMRALKLQQNETYEQRMARKRLRNRIEHLNRQQKQKMQEQQQQMINDSHNMTNNEMNKHV